MKSYTDIEQSKKLAEILSLESADMCHNVNKMHKQMPPLMTPYSRFKEFYDMESTPDFLIPCWSLTALLSIYPMVVGRDMDMYCCWQNSKNLHSRHYDNPVDAVVEMILKLKEKNLL